MGVLQKLLTGNQRHADGPVEAVWNGRVIARTDDAVVVEGNHYFPLADVDESVLVPSEKRTTCPWKGVASYRSVEVDGQRNADAAWSYPEPKEAAAAIKDRVAFWRGVEVRPAEG